MHGVNIARIFYSPGRRFAGPALSSLRGKRAKKLNLIPLAVGTQPILLIPANGVSYLQHELLFLLLSTNILTLMG